MIDQHDLKIIGENLLKRLEVKTDNLGEALSELNEIVRDCLQHDSCEEAFQCCKMAIALCDGLQPERGTKLEPSYAQAIFHTYMGTSYLNQGKLELAMECYNKSRTLFHGKLQERWNEGLLLITIGKLHQSTGKLHDAFLAFQQSLSSFQDVTSDSRDRSGLVKEAQTELKKTGQLLRNSWQSKGKHQNPIRAKPHRVKPADIVTIPLVAKIAAGSPIPAEENIKDHLFLHKNYARDATFALQVQGDSLVNAGVHNNDIVLIREQPVANNGDIVAVTLTDIDAEATLKRFYQEESHIRLQPENDAEKPIIIVPRYRDVDPVKAQYQQKGIDVHIFAEVKVDIVGKVVGVLRLY